MNKEQQLQNLVLGDLEQEEDIGLPSSQKSLLRTYLRILRRKAPLIAIITGLTTLGALWFASRESSAYLGSFQILVEPLSSEEKLTDASTLARTKGVVDERLLGLDYPTQIAILRGVNMQEKIAQKVFIKYPYIDINYLRKSLEKNLRVEQPKVGKSRFDVTKIIQVDYAERDPKLVKVVLELTAEEYLNYSLDERQNNITAGVDFINTQILELRKKVKDLQLQLQNFQDKYKIVNPLTRTEELFTQIHELDKQETQVKNQLKELKQLYQSLEKQLALNPHEALVASALSEDPKRQNLLVQIQQIDSQIAVTSARFTSNSPQLQTLENQRQKLLELLSQENEKILGKNLNSDVANPQIFTFQNSLRLALIGQLIETANQIDILEVRYQSLQKTRAKIEKTAKRFPEIVRQYSQIEQQLTLTNEILNQLLSQRETLQVEAAEKDFPWQIISKPHIPLDERGQPITFKSNPTKKLLAGFMGGFILSSAVAVLLEKSRDIFYSTKDIEDAVSLKFLGEIFISTETRSKPKSIFGRLFNSNNNLDNLDNLESWLEVEPGQLEERHQAEKSIRNSRFNHLPIKFWLSLVDRDCLAGILFLRESLKLEGFELLYSRLRFLYREQPIRSLVVSSVESGDGQSLVAFNLAQAALTKNERVLLIDMNGYKPKFYNWSNLDDDRELLERLETTWSKNMQSTMEELHAKYDLVIYDTPHFFESSNIKFLANYTDGFLMVVRTAKTSQALVKQAVSQIKEFNLPTLGVVATVFKLGTSILPKELTQKSSLWARLSNKWRFKWLGGKSGRTKKEGGGQFLQEQTW